MHANTGAVSERTHRVSDALLLVLGLAYVSGIFSLLSYLLAARQVSSAPPPPQSAPATAQRILH